MENVRDRKNESVSCGQDDGILARSMESADWMEQVRNLNTEHVLKTGKVRTYRLDVFGCQMNEQDAETIAGMPQI